MSSGNHEQSQTTDMMTFADEVIARCASAGATDAEVYLRRGRESELEVRNGEVERLVEGQPSGIGIRLWKGDRSSSAFATQLSWETVDRLVADTLDMAAFSDPIPEQSLVDDELLAQDVPEDLDLHDPSISTLTTEEKLERLRSIESRAMQSDERLSISGGARYGDHDVEHVLATSRGFRGGYRETMVSSYVEVIANDDDGKKRNGGWFDVARFYEDQLDEDELIARAVERAVGHIGSRPLKTGSIPVVFDPYAASALFRELFSVLVGSAIERGSSFLSDALHTQIAGEGVSLIDDPLRKRGIGSRPFDGEGLPSRLHRFIDRGTLQSFALNAYHARKLGMAPTGHASRPASGAPGESFSNLYLAPGPSSAEDLIESVDDGFYCESMMGFGFNPATGDFSRGASGYRIEGGKLTHPVSEITLSLGMKEILSGIVGIADDLRFDRSLCCPHLRIDGMTVAGS